MMIESYILAGVWLATVIGFGIVIRRQQRRLDALQEDLRGRRYELARVQSDLGALTQASVGAGDHIMKVERQIRRLIERQDQTDMRSVSDRPYSQAIQLVQQGAGVDELIQQCGLTRGEADLITMLHGVAKAG